MKSEFSYVYNGEDLIARDGRFLEEVFKKSINTTESKANWDPRLKFEIRRVHEEWEEYQDMLEMAKGNAPNTMIVISDFPEEMRNSPVDIGGYNVTRQQAMLRVITKDSAGVIHVISRSLDKSDRDGLEAICDFMGFKAKPGELLSQRIKLDIEEPFKASLDDRLVSVYDGVLSRKFGGEWHAGRNPAEDINTMEFAAQQDDLINTYLAGPQGYKERYDLSAAISARYKLLKQGNNSGMGQILFLSPEVEMQIQGKIAAKNGLVFSGCGGTIKMSVEDEVSSLGFGIGVENDNSSDEDMKCVNCPECKTFHEKVRRVAGKPVCDNPGCKLSDKKHQEPPVVSDEDSGAGVVISIKSFLARKSKESSLASNVA